MLLRVSRSAGRYKVEVTQVTETAGLRYYLEALEDIIDVTSTLLAGTPCAMHLPELAMVVEVTGFSPPHEHLGVLAAHVEDLLMTRQFRPCAKSTLYGSSWVDWAVPPVTLEIKEAVAMQKEIDDARTTQPENG
jgi:hypothetical protein